MQTNQQYTPGRRLCLNRMQDTASAILNIISYPYQSRPLEQLPCPHSHSCITHVSDVGWGTPMSPLKTPPEPLRPSRRSDRRRGASAPASDTWHSRPSRGSRGSGSRRRSRHTGAPRAPRTETAPAGGGTPRSGTPGRSTAGGQNGATERSAGRRGRRGRGPRAGSSRGARGEGAAAAATAPHSRHSGTPGRGTAGGPVTGQVRGHGQSSPDGAERCHRSDSQRPAKPVQLHTGGVIDTEVSISVNM